MLARPFTRGEALASGITDSRLRGRDLRRPFAGVRLHRDLPDELIWNARALSLRMSRGQAFGGVTAAQLYGLPLPLARSGSPVLSVAASGDSRIPRLRGVESARIDSAFFAIRGHICRDFERGEIFELPILRPDFLFAQLASSLEPYDLVALGDAIVTRGLATVDDLRSVSAASTGRRGARAMRWAVPQVRVGALSRPETLLRALMVSAGFPEPAINTPIVDEHGVVVRTPDLSWPEFRVACQYEGDGHRGIRQFRSDISRDEECFDVGWHPLKAHADDLFVDTEAFLARAGRRLVARGWELTREIPKIAPFRP